MAPLQRAWQLTHNVLPELCPSRYTVKCELSLVLGALRANFQRWRLLYILMFIAILSVKDKNMRDACFVSESSGGSKGQNLSPLCALLSLDS